MVNILSSTNPSLCNETELETLKWHFYAYAHGCDVLFRSDNKNISFNAEQCDIVIECERISVDTLFAKCTFLKDTLIGHKLYNCLAVEKALFFNGLFKPLTGHLVVENFQDTSQLLKDNKETIENFKNYLIKADTVKLSTWLKAKQNG